MTSLPLFIPKNINKYFYNRKKDIEKINYYLNSLNVNISQQLLITGCRGVGKTFLLQKIIKEANSNFLTTYIDISQIYAINDNNFTKESILIELLEHMNQALKNKSNTKLKRIYTNINTLINNLKIKNYDFKDASTLLNIPISSIENDYKKLSKFVMEFPQKVVDNVDNINGFIIIMDEFQMLKKLNNPEAFFWLIRSYSQFQENVSYVLSGSVSRTSDVIEMVNGETGSFGGRMIQINIEPFTKEETKNYFLDKLSNITFTEDGFNRFYKCTRGIPAYINSFYNVLSSDEIYDDKKVIETFKRNTDQILVMWIKIWGTLNSYEKSIIITIIEDDNVTWKKLVEKTSYSTATINKYLISLQNKGIISYLNKNYYLEDMMLKSWLIHEKEVMGIYPL